MHRRVHVYRHVYRRVHRHVPCSRSGLALVGVSGARREGLANELSYAPSDSCRQFFLKEPRLASDHRMRASVLPDCMRIKYTRAHTQAEHVCTRPGIGFFLLGGPKKEFEKNFSSVRFWGSGRFEIRQEIFDEGPFSVREHVRVSHDGAHQRKRSNDNRGQQFRKQNQRQCVRACVRACVRRCGGRRHRHQRSRDRSAVLDLQFFLWTYVGHVYRHACGHLSNYIWARTMAWVQACAYHAWMCGWTDEWTCE